MENVNLPCEIIEYIISLADERTKAVFSLTSKYADEYMNYRDREFVKVYLTIMKIEKIREHVVMNDHILFNKIYALEETIRDQCKKLREETSKKNLVLSEKDVKCFCGEYIDSRRFHNHVKSKKHAQLKPFKIVSEKEDPGQRYYDYYIEEKD